MIQTVLGPVSSDVLGPTLMHEHVLCDITPPELALQRLPEVEIRLDNLFEIRHQWCRHTGHHVLTDRDLAVGAVLEFDFFGIESTYCPFADIDLPNDGQRVNYIVELARRGHVRQFVVAHDICTRTRLRRFGGHGYGHLLENAVPLLRRRGLSDHDVAQILVETPRRLLAFG